MEDFAILLGGLIGEAINVALWVATWNLAKKRKIGLTKASYLSLFLTVIVGFFVTLFSKKINKTTKQPTYKQRLPYENTTAMLIAAILYILYGVALDVVGMFSGNEGAYYHYLIQLQFIIALAWGILLLFERRNLLRRVMPPAYYAAYSVPCGKGFVFETNMQRVTSGSIHKGTSDTFCWIVAEENGDDVYRVSIIGVTGRTILQPVLMKKMWYTKLDECMTLVSDDTEYVLRVFYNAEQIVRCVIYRKSIDLHIYYLIE
ncbi:MAG: hypothetical protein IJ760_08305 [Bacteroidales bacterium]|nr:hypothetical protein [Bacteroidales bacterium]